MDSDYIELLNSQIRKFRAAIMRDYWSYRRSTPVAAGFKCLDLSTKEYELLKFFDIRLEEYIRRYLFDGFFGRILEHRGNGVYPANISSISSDKHYRNSEFEKIVPFEFVVESIINGKLIGVRYSDFAIGDIQIADNIDEVFVLTWGSIGGGSQQSKIVLDNGTIVYHSCLREFMVYLGFSPDEYSEYVTALYGVIDEVQDLIGIKTIPALNPPMLFRFRFEVEKMLKNHVSELKKHSESEEEIRKISPETIDEYTWAYQIIDPENKIKYPTIEQQSKALLIRFGALNTYSSKQYYQAIIGTSDFAKSFITSEYLYRQYNCNDRFDYTAVVSGYLKCIEQLLFHIVCFAKGKELQIKSTNIKLDDGTKLPPKVDFSTTSLDNGWCDTTLGSLTTFLNESKSHIISNKKSKGCIYNCLKCFIRECRNESFHKHNIRNWSRVEIIRNNTIILIELLLGCCKLGETQQETDKDLQIIRNDRFERAYCWITSVPADSFYVVFNDESPVHVKMGLSSEYPRFSDYGLISDYLISLDNIESEGPRQRVIGNIQIGRNRTPDKMWYLDSCGNKVEWDQ